MKEVVVLGMAMYHVGDGVFGGEVEGHCVYVNIVTILQCWKEACLHTLPQRNRVALVKKSPRGSRWPKGVVGG